MHAGATVSGLIIVLVGIVSMALPMPTLARIDQELTDWLDRLLGDGSARLLHRLLCALLIIFGVHLVMGTR